MEPVREAVLMIDESSMIDLWLMDQVMARLTENTVLFLVGDVDQLPSVGPGAILQDLIAAGEQGRAPRVAVTRLNTIFRQEAGNESLIVVNCHRVRAGERPLRGKGANCGLFRDVLRHARRRRASWPWTWWSTACPNIWACRPPKCRCWRRCTTAKRASAP